MRKGMRRIHLLIRFIILVICLAAQAHNAQAATIHVIAGKGVSQVLANEFGSITTKVMDFYEEVYSYRPVNSVSVVLVADEPAYIQRLLLEGHSKEQAARIAKVTAGMFLNSKFSDSPNVAVKYTLSGRKLEYENPVIIICVDKNTSYLSRLRMVTHEMFHHMQRELKGNTPAHEWLAEGSAEVSEFVLLEWMGKGSLASRRHNLINTLVNAKLRADPDELKNGGAGWIKLIENTRYPYEVSESMTEYLMRQVGKPPIIRYFALIGENHDRNAAFQKAFGMNYTQFVDRYQAYIKQESAAAGRIKFDVEGVVAPEVVQTISKLGASTEQILRSQGWTMTKSQRFTLVPNTDVMLNVLRRELPETDADGLAGMARRGPMGAIEEWNYVYNTGKMSGSDRDFISLALIVCRGSVIMTAQPASATRVHWLFEGTAQLLAARAVEALEGRRAADSRKEWLHTMRKAKGYPSLTQMNSSITAVNSRYGGEVIFATVALATDYLVEKTDPGALLRYFTVLRDLNDGPRAFQQVFGMPIEAFAVDFDAYINAQRE